jgi:RNA recognition motif-containing protein
MSVLVLSANIITRGQRSRGYGFVEMATLQDAQKAVDALNHKEIHSRQINVEIGRSFLLKRLRSIF